jgi:tetratricopeptide (TPR) repeat protein
MNYITPHYKRAALLTSGFFTSIIIVLIAKAEAAQVLAQDSLDRKMYEAYLSRDAEMQVWKEVIETLSSTAGKKPADPQAGFSVAYAYFGLLSAAIKVNNEEWFDDHYDAALNALNHCTKLNQQWAEPYALKGAIYGLKITFSSTQAMFLGPKSSNLIDKAVKLNKESALVWKLYGNSKFFTPEIWGGSIDEAIAAYERSILLYERQPDQLKFNWLYLDALAFLGQSYYKKGEYAKAVATYEKALAAEPAFGWVERMLLPKARAGK